MEIRIITKKLKEISMITIIITSIKAIKVEDRVFMATEAIANNMVPLRINMTQAIRIIDRGLIMEIRTETFRIEVISKTKFDMITEEDMETRVVLVIKLFNTIKIFKWTRIRIKNLHILIKISSTTIEPLTPDLTQTIKTIVKITTISIKTINRVNRSTKNGNKTDSQETIAITEMTAGVTTISGTIIPTSSTTEIRISNKTSHKTSFNRDKETIAITSIETIEEATTTIIFQTITSFHSLKTCLLRNLCQSSRINRF